MIFDPDKFPEIEVTPRYELCHKCQTPVDLTKIYVTIFPERKKRVLHIECFYQDYIPDEDEPKA